MKLTKFNSSKLVNVNLHKYVIDWNAPSCSKFQTNCKNWLKTYWRHYICLEEFRIPGSLLRCDIVNISKKLIVEISGEQHETFNKHFHRGNRQNFLDSIKRDFDKRNWAEANGFKIIEIYPDDLPLSLSFFVEKFGIEIP